MPPTPPPAPAARFARLIAALCEAVGARVAGPGRPGLAGPLVILIWTRLKRMAERVARLAARAEAGTLPPPRSRPATPRRTAAPPYQRLPRGAAWLIRQVPAAAFGAGQVEALLADPDMAALIAAAPQIGRTLRPLCHMLGVSLPPALRRPPPASPSPLPAPPCAAEAGRRVPAEPLGTVPARVPAFRPERPPPAPEVARPGCGPPLPAPA